MLPRIWAPSRRAPIPETIRDDLRARLLRHTIRKWRQRIANILVRFHGRHAYVAATKRKKGDQNPVTLDRYAPDRVVPVELCRLGYRGHKDEWEYAFYKYSDERYEPSIMASGHFTATPEQCFDTAAGGCILAEGVGGRLREKAGNDLRERSASR